MDPIAHYNFLADAHGLIRDYMGRVSQLPDRSASQRADEDAAVLVRLMSDEQVRTFGGTSDRDAVRELIRSQRLEALMLRPDTSSPHERQLLDRAQPIPRGRLLLVRILDVLAIACTLAIPVCLVAMFFYGWLFVVLLAAPVLGVGLLTARWLVASTVEKDRLRSRLSWAVTRSGQLGRGLPGSAPAVSISGAFDLMAYLMAYILLIVGSFLTFSGFGVALISLVADGPGSDLVQIGLQTGAGGAGLLLLSWGVAAAWGALQRSERRRASATEWLVEQAQHDA
ncbi:hypothetical protein ACQBAT_14815 [Ornithinimicrobium sp. Y1847]|uniref:hypothetical protein n=1 Tax=unclassified Ornithinimicrobium TaxID=2615080 RepID=UPI003B67B73B